MVCDTHGLRPPDARMCAARRPSQYACLGSGLLGHVAVRHGPHLDPGHRAGFARADAPMHGPRITGLEPLRQNQPRCPAVAGRSQIDGCVFGDVPTRAAHAPESLIDGNESIAGAFGDALQAPQRRRFPISRRWHADLSHVCHGEPSVRSAAAVSFGPTHARPACTCVMHMHAYAVDPPRRLLSPATWPPR